MLELVNDLMSDITPLYLYLSIALSMICAYRGISLNMHMINQNNDFATRQWHAARFRLLPRQEDLGANTEIQNWIATKTKRIEAPDDDTDAHSFLFSTATKKKRGGQQWKENLYSHPLQNIALSGLF
ncbi:hypothetical protein F3157_09470 [Virgibacillus dakarensis]|uniref:Uncharacterized protein n=1 Tax=Lentibacillus populi TaxID=1827502 RepID=A0A9W5U277_9BACI|nr:hypothetical protein [Lentibacillus populi]MBT2216420.1 hypothetical protein [Virgibacillus dakarensis]MTW85884.1 hypothetical protein [Virgibacillus dakarensis]GGB61600.1 hypothetical protein GCM10011409_43530 [Lentibacillus populi]